MFSLSLVYFSYLRIHKLLITILSVFFSKLYLKSIALYIAALCVSLCQIWIEKLVDNMHNR